MFQTEIIDIIKEWERGIEKAAAIIKAGGVVAFPTETVYGLGADGLNPRAVERIFTAKERPADNPLILHVAGMEQTAGLVHVTPLAQKLLGRFWPGPLTAVLRKKPVVPDIVTAGRDTAAVRMPGHACPLAIIDKSGCPVAAPSANRSGSPSTTSAAHVFSDMQGRIPLILDGGETRVGLESTVCDLTGDVPVILRPGGVTAEMLADAAGGVSFAQGVRGGSAEERGAPPAPGMKYRHYAPKAELVIVHADGGARVAQRLMQAMQEDARRGVRAIVLCTSENENFFGDGRKIVLGSIKDMGMISKNLFAALRRADEMGADRAYVLALPESGLGLAVMNRLRKAASRELRF